MVRVRSQELKKRRQQSQRVVLRAVHPEMTEEEKDEVLAVKKLRVLFETGKRETKVLPKVWL
jgi:hypothetical protein